MLTPAVRTVLFRYCRDHPVACCHQCDRAYRLTELGTDFFENRTDLCPECRIDLSVAVLLHVEICPTLPLEHHERVRELVDQSWQLIKASRMLTDVSRRSIAEYDARKRQRDDPGSEPAGG